ncbi:MAG TPA: hypothetical protein VGN85_02165 [Methyloceanibacter sp.]|nr:hypothetical protein [Methyloceanibacter sp.]
MLIIIGLGPPLQNNERRGPCGASGRGYIDQREAFLARRVGATLIKRDGLKRCGTMLRGGEGRRKLQCVGR